MQPEGVCSVRRYNLIDAGARRTVKHFILDTDRRVIEVDLLTWGRWVGTVENRELARTEVRHLLVLTSFAGIDISFGEGSPAFFETRVLDGMDELAYLESSSWHEAVGRHQALTERWTGWADAARSATERALAI
jgi:hypothetical protein